MFHVRPEVTKTSPSLQATGDPYYLRVGQSIVEKLNAYARVPCGFAAVQDVRTGMHEDRCASDAHLNRSLRTGVVEP